MSDTLSHLDEHGDARMVDVGHKDITKRRAVVRCRVNLSEKTFSLLSEAALPKGDALATAKIAGILAAKQTPNLIPLCHPLPLSYADVRFDVDADSHSVGVECEVRTTSNTGVEMEAIIGAQVAAATIYDMVKAVQKDVTITDLRLIHKSGGNSGTFEAE